MMAHRPLITTRALHKSYTSLSGFAPLSRGAQSLLTELAFCTNELPICSRNFCITALVSNVKFCSVPSFACSPNKLRGYGTLRCFSTTTPSSSKPKPSPSEDRSLQEAPESRGGALKLSSAEKVKENVKTASYGGVIVVGLGVTGLLLYYVLNELFSSESPNNIYSHAFKMCKLSMEVQDALGSPIKCYGEETRRGWRRHVACQEFVAGETKFIRMRFYIQGQFKKGTVNVEKRTNDRGKYEYTYITVDIDGYPPRRINVPF